ncbi:MAG: DUF3108 domain-containing protein [SAR202 cluster bacterium]|nr:DUF3108 domain-containing protein [SAR202 cluster bacterium]
MRLITIYILIISFLYSNNEDWDEVLNYSAYFSGIHVANATLKSKQKKDLNNKDILNIEFQAKSRSSVKYIFPINDIISIEVETENWEPIRVEKKLREGNYIHNSIAEFNHDERKFIFKKDTIAFLENVMNPYSLIYFFRTKTLTPDTSYQINIVDNKKIMALSFNVEHREKIKIPKGSFFANKIWPQRNDGRPFKNAGKMTIWYSENEKIPVMINLKLKFGSLNLELVEIN